jgi:hypothetical protein
MKKIISTILAGVLAVSALATTAFAEDIKITAEGIVAKPAIKVTMPKTMNYVFNPYKLKVDEKGKIDAENGKADIVVCSYNNTAKDAWEITSTTGADLKAAIYAYALNKEDATFLVLDKTITTSDTDKTKKTLHLEIKAKGDDEATVKLQNVALDTKTTPLWEEANKESGATAFVVKKFNESKPLQITMTGTTANAGKLVWEEKDTSKVNFIFGFEYADPTT